jgi:hypothetical protein
VKSFVRLHVTSRPHDTSLQVLLFVDDVPYMGRGP